MHWLDRSGVVRGGGEVSESRIAGYVANVFYCPELIWDRLLVARVAFDVDGALVGHKLVPEARLAAIRTLARSFGHDDPEVSFDLVEEVESKIVFLGEPAVFDTSMRAVWDRRCDGIGNAMSMIQATPLQPWNDTPIDKIIAHLIPNIMRERWEAAK